jgi:PAS domain S-box-containing protein
MKKSELAEHTLAALQEAAELRRRAAPGSAPALLKELNAVLADLQATRAELNEKDQALASLQAELESQRERCRRLGEQLLSDERFRIAAESAPCALVMADETGEIVFANTRAESLFGYQRDELLGRSIELLVPRAKRSEHEKHRDAFFGKAHAARHLGAGRNLHCLHKDGSECPVEVGLTQIETPHGRLVLSSIVDITERRQLERQLEERNKEISRTQALAGVGRMANMVAHDLRNPLSSIKMGLQILGKEPALHSGAEQQELRQIALEQVRYMEGILVDLLDYSRESPLKPEWLDIGKLLDAATLIVQKTIEDRGAHVTTRFQSGLPTLHGDGDKLRQVFSNLLVNAVHRGLHGGDPCIHPSRARNRPAADTYRNSRQRLWSGDGEGGQAVRAVLHHTRQGHRSRTRHRRAHHSPAWRKRAS